MNEHGRVCSQGKQIEQRKKGTKIEVQKKEQTLEKYQKKVPIFTGSKESVCRRFAGSANKFRSLNHN
jgi:hypothetical protein